MENRFHFPLRCEPAEDGYVRVVNSKHAVIFSAQDWKKPLCDKIVSAVNEQFEREQEAVRLQEAEKNLEETMEAQGYVGYRIGESEGKSYRWKEEKDG